MLLWLLLKFQTSFPPLRVIRYVSFRVIAAMVTATLISVFLFPAFIRALQRMQIGQVVRDDGPESHFSKAGTPTMGGALLLIALILSTLLWMDLSSAYVWVTLVVTFALGCVGFVDDYLKVSKKNSKGLAGRYKLLAQFLAGGLAVGYLLLYQEGFESGLYLPFLSPDRFYLPLPLWLFIPFAMVVIAGTSNAVNLTDGLDGLAIGPVMIATGCFLILAYATGTVLHLPMELADGSQTLYAFNLAKYLGLPYLPEASELAVFAAALIGAGVGFLWYNAYPAQVFMGDVGSLALGGGIGMLAVLTRNELLSLVICGLFLVEALSVIMQTTSYKLRRKRIFKMAPIHHHFEKLGWTEPKIVVRFWIVSILLALLALSTLKLR
ncbi:MAG: phospho-N-acetylmuramoyl-pentapeptide-transferase [Myxococcota bacterium]|nr:phospho-N-acetylmuramoyl-pentapeptide-transferase [Myxococcota bacterium]